MKDWCINFNVSLCVISPVVEILDQNLTCVIEFGAFLRHRMSLKSIWLPLVDTLGSHPIWCKTN